MQTLLALGVSLLAVTSGQAQPSALTAAKPITVTFVRTVTFDQVISFLARMSETTIEFDETVSEEVRQAPIAETTITFRNVTLLDALGLVTSRRGLDYRVVDGKTVVIFKKA